MSITKIRHEHVIIRHSQAFVNKSYFLHLRSWFFNNAAFDCLQILRRNAKDFINNQIICK